MTKNELLNGTYTVTELVQIANDLGCYVLDIVKDSDDYNEFIWDGINNWDEDWESLGRWLDDLPSEMEDSYYDTSDFWGVMSYTDTSPVYTDMLKSRIIENCWSHFAEEPIQEQEIVISNDELSALFN